MPWTPESQTALEDMWLWGHSSGTISKTIGEVSRNAVMGKIYRMDLMGRGGERIGSRLKGAKINVQAVGEAITQITGEDYTWDDDVSRACMVQMTAVMVGNHGDAIIEATGYPAIEVAQTIQTMRSSGVWPEGDKPPSQWWEPKLGDFTFLMDAMVTAGILIMNTLDGERAYAHPDNIGKNP